MEDANMKFDEGKWLRYMKWKDRLIEDQHDMKVRQYFRRLLKEFDYDELRFLTQVLIDEGY